MGKGGIERATIIGVIFGTFMWMMGAFLTAGDLITYWDVSSLFITGGGSLASVLIAIEWKNLGKIRTIVGMTFRPYTIDVAAMIDTLVTFAEKARREGVLALEDDVAEVQDTFLKRAIQLVVDGTDPEAVKTIMENEISQMENRHAQARKILEDWGYFAPSWGMIGTLVGLVAMLKTLSDKASIGPKMATALLTTLYGAILANHFLLPMASKLDQYNKYDVLVKEIVLEGVLSIQAGDNPQILKEKLNSFIAMSERQSEERAGEE